MANPAANKIPAILNPCPSRSTRSFYDRTDELVGDDFLFAGLLPQIEPTLFQIFDIHCFGVLSVGHLLQFLLYAHQLHGHVRSGQTRDLRYFFVTVLLQPQQYQRLVGGCEPRHQSVHFADASVASVVLVKVGVQRERHVHGASATFADERETRVERDAVDPRALRAVAAKRMRRLSSTVGQNLLVVVGQSLVVGGIDVAYTVYDAFVAFGDLQESLFVHARFFHLRSRGAVTVRLAGYESSLLL